MRFVNSQQRWEHAVAIVTRVRELVVELDQLPKVPVVAFLPAEMRRQFRRYAARLRAGKVEPRYPNLFTAEQLADICEQAAYRDECLERIVKELHALSDELQALLAENEAELGKERMAELLPAKDAAQWLGPDSVAEQRYREIQQVRRKGQRNRNRKRPRKPEPPELMPLPGTDYELHMRHWISAAESIPEGTDEERIALRIGVGAMSWTGTFQRGDTSYTTVRLMPDNANLLVVAAGAASVVDARSHAVIADLGRDIETVICDEASSLLLLNHGGKTLEAFGPEGRMWSTGAIASGGFRSFRLADGVMTFEACQAEGGWVEAEVDVATGECR